MSFYSWAALYHHTPQACYTDSGKNREPNLSDFWLDLPTAIRPVNVALSCYPGYELLLRMSSSKVQISALLFTYTVGIRIPCSYLVCVPNARETYWKSCGSLLLFPPKISMHEGLLENDFWSPGGFAHDPWAYRNQPSESCSVWHNLPVEFSLLIGPFLIF